MSLEQRINYQLNKFPVIKKIIKRVYQRSMCFLGGKFSCEGNIVRISPMDGMEYFFGYYDKSPWDISDRYMLCLRVENTWKEVSPRDKADIVIIDTHLDVDDPQRVKKIAETNTWNVQQGCMLQWLGPDFNNKIIYNDCREGQYCSIILSLNTMEEQIIRKPIYTVSNDGKLALSLDFSRLYNLRPGYGYYNVVEETFKERIPNQTCIWKIDLSTGEITDLLKYTDFSDYLPRREMKEKESVHKVNHLMLSPNCKRFMVLHRWFVGAQKFTRLITCGVDGKEMYLLLDEDMVSHCCWKDDEHILAYANKYDSGVGYYLMKDRTTEYCHYWKDLLSDGHPSFSPTGKQIVTDTYPNRSRISSIYILEEPERKEIVAKVFSPFKYDNDTRCDLHPRWNRRGDKICFDSAFENKRGLYVVDLEYDKEKEI